jgi:PAS domain S-box-containing protein
MTTVHKNTEEALEEKARLLDLANDAILVRDALDRITFWNRGAVDMYGFSQDEAIGRVSHDLLHTEFPEPLESIKEKFLREGSWAGELRHICANGARKTVSTRWIVERDACGSVRSVLESNRDITEANQAREVQNRLAAIVESSDDAIISKGLDGIITSWNKAAERIFGYAANEAIDHHITLIIPSDRKDEENEILTRIGRGERVGHFQTVRQRKDGTRIDVSVTISPIRDSSGRVIGASKVARDITAKKRAENALRESEQRYQAVIDASQVQDDERRRIARELHDSAGQTLTVLGLGLAQLAQKAEATTPEFAKEAREIEIIVQQLNREIRTTSYLLHPPLLDEAGIRPALSWYVQGATERSGIAIDLSISEKFGRLPADMELAIFRVVQECLTNIHRHAESKTACIRVAREKSHVHVEVRDEGKGISPERLEEIQTKGSGVGIAGIRERLRRFRGEMKIESCRGSGTVVSANIPIPNETPKEEFEPHQAARLKGDFTFKNVSVTPE